MSCSAATCTALAEPTRTLERRALNDDNSHPLVEDHEEIWDFLSRRLKRRGYDVVVATDGQEGVDKARSEHPNVILLDMNLPVMDGWTAAGHIKKDPSTAHVPIIAITAHAMSGDHAKAIAAGCDDYHAKPVDFSLLVVQIEALAGGTPAAARG